MQVLIVEDDVRLAQALAHILAENGYQTDVVHDGASGLAYAECGDYDVIILDVMLPKMDGFAVVAQLRRKSISVPVLLLTARDAVPDKITGLDSGADDYMTKPFAIEELLARIRLVLKKRSSAAGTAGRDKNQLGVGRLHMDVQRYEVSYDGKQVELTHREFELLRVLLENKNIVISRDTLLEKVCGYDYMGETNIIDVYVRYLRSKLDDVYQVKIIQTVRGVGYCIKDEN